jgi:hypothetical protein
VTIAVPSGFRIDLATAGALGQCTINGQVVACTFSQPLPPRPGALTANLTLTSVGPIAGDITATVSAAEDRNPRTQTLAVASDMAIRLLSLRPVLNSTTGQVRRST